MDIINHFKEIANNKGLHFILLYKSGMPQSECAFDNIKKAIKEVPVKIYLADVNKTRDVHQPLRVTSAPSLVIREGKQVKQIIKGCQSPGFYQTLFQGREFTSVHTTAGRSSGIIVYTTPTCTYCNALKSYLTEKKVQFTEIDVSQDQQAAQEMVSRSGQQGVPQSLVNGEVVVGFDRPKINQLLNIK